MNIEQYNDLYALLNKRNYYSLEIKYVSRILDVSVYKLKRLDYKKNNNYSIEFKELFGTHINIFTYNNITYIGLESRRIDYERDKELGCNWVEDAIKNGEYD